MKDKLINLGIISGFLFLMLLFYVPVIFWATSCNKEELNTEITTVPGTEFKEYKITQTLNDAYCMAQDSGWINSRFANDGIFDLVWLGDGFNQQNKWFFDSLCDHQQAFIHATLDSLFNANNIQIRFTRKLARGNFNCVSTGGLDAALTCNWDKIVKAAFSNGDMPDFIHIFSYNNGYGTGNGGIGITGVGNESLLTSPWVCPYWEREPKISGHEDGHAFGLAHDFTVGNLMWYATNGGCALGNNYLPYQQQTILNYIDSRIN